MLKMSSRIHKKRSGQATVEFALILIVLLAVVYGIIEISRLLLVNAEIQNAAREGAHYASLHPNVDADSCLRERVIGPKLSLVNPSQITVTKTLLTTGGPGFDPITAPYPVVVTVNYTWNSLVNIMPDMSTLTLRPLGPLPLEGSSTAFIENADHSSVTTSCPAVSPGP
jgi:Flp pilus assembly protein TadG